VGRATTAARRRASPACCRAGCRVPLARPGAAGLPGDGSFGYGGGYRGVFRDVAVLVLADQGSHDDVFCGRALCGDDGQHLEGVVEAIGADGRTLIVRVLPMDTLGVAWPTIRRLVDDPRTVALHRELHRRVRAANPGLALVLAVGPQARRLVAALPTDPLPVLPMKAWRERGARADWQRTIAHVRERCAAGDLPTLLATADGRRTAPDLRLGRPASSGAAARPAVRRGPLARHLR
jgi:hypothetical protein